MLHRRSFCYATAAAVAAMLAGATASVAQAQSKATAAAPAAAAIAPDQAKQFINDMGNRTVSVLSAATTPEARNKAFTQVMLEAIDFDSLATQTLGKMARTVRPDDKKEFTTLFAAYVIDVAVQKFGTTQVANFTIGEMKKQPNGDIKVNTLINTSEKPLNVDWRVHTRAGKPCINDIEVEGYSLVIHYRGEFERAGVSTVPGLINKLQGLTQQSVALPTVRATFK